MRWEPLRPSEPAGPVTEGAAAHGPAGADRPWLCPSFSERLRSARTARALSLRELAGRIGVSASLLSQVETGKVHPSVNTLYALARELGLSLDDLLFADDATAPTQPAADGAAATAAVTRSAERTRIALNTQVRWERLTADSRDGVDFFHVVYEPGGASVPAGSRHRHAGREWGLVTRGQLRLEIGDDVHELGAGDSVTFDSSLPHRLHNPGAEELHAIWVVVGRTGDSRLAG
jgi:transcriptional regulator with XRE-family HTH domain